MDIGIVTDEVMRDVAKALEMGAAWGLSRFELREGARKRFPYFTAEEIRATEAAMQQGHQITAVSPGILKGHVEDKKHREHELNEVLPRAIDLARHVESPVLIVFGFARYDGEPEQNRLLVLRAFERVAEAAAEADLTVAVENEPRFWIDRPAETAALIEELGHPSFKVNWDPANLYWGGTLPTYEAFCTLRPHLANVHVKDYAPDNLEEPWQPLGRGQTPWNEILAWMVAETDLAHVTLETHCEPLITRSKESLDALRALLAEAGNVERKPVS